MEHYDMKSVTVSFAELLELLKLPQASIVHEVWIGGTKVDDTDQLWDGETSILIEYDIKKKQEGQ